MSYELTEPHFDDERTLLSARRVIPLDRVEAISRRKQWWLSATIAVAAALGTLGGFIYYRQSTPAPIQHSLRQSTQAGVGATFEEPAESAFTETTEQLGVEEEAVEASDDVSDEFSVDSARRTPRRPSTVIKPVAKSNPAEDEAAAEVDEEGMPASRQVDRWEERRERRIRRRNRDEQPNDLFRIDQIFEGAPRP